MYLTFLENKKPIDQVLDIIKSKHNLIRYQVGLNLTIKHTPQLRFYHDDTLLHAERINDIIKKIHEHD